MIIKPLGNKVLVAEKKMQMKTESGIIIEGAKSTNESPAGKVLAVGPDVTLVNVGDTIYLDWQKASVVVVDGAQRVMIAEDNIIAVLED